MIISACGGCQKKRDQQQSISRPRANNQSRPTITEQSQNTPQPASPKFQIPKVLPPLK